MHMIVNVSIKYSMNTVINVCTNPILMNIELFLNG